MTSTPTQLRATPHRIRARYAPFFAVEAATILAGIANGITMVAFPWLVLEMTGSAAAAGVIAALTALPTIVAALFSGTIVDLFGRRRTSVVSDALSFLSVIAVPIFAATGQLTLAVLAVLALLGAIFDPAGVTARESMLPGAARAARMPLERVNGLHEAMFGIAFVIGPAAGGLLIGLVGATTAFVATAVCFALSIVVISAVRIPAAGRPVDRQHGVWEATRHGVAFLWRAPLLRTLALLYMVLVASYMPIEAIILPAWFQAQGRPEALGTLLLTLSMGGVIGSLLYAAIGPRLRQRRMLVVATAFTTLPLLGFAALPPFAVMLVLAFTSGFFWGPINPMVNLAIQRTTPGELLGRVNGIFVGVAFALAPVGYLIAGVLYSAFGVQITLAVFAAALFVLGVTLASRPVMRGLDDLPSPTH